VGAVDVRVGHDDNFAVAGFFEVKVAADSAAERRNHGPDFGVVQNRVQAGFFDIENFAAQRQDRLKTAVPSLFRRTARRIALHQIDFRLHRIPDRTIGQFSRQGTNFQGAFPPGQFAGFSRRIPSPGGQNRLFNNLAGNGRIFFEKLTEFLKHHRVDNSPDFAVSQF